MKYREFGRTGFSVSEVGFGTWGLGGDAYGPTDDVVSIACLRRAVDRGINFYDTSDLYGAGHSEEVLGRAFEGIRDKVLIGTKVGLLPHSGFHMPVDFSPDYIHSAIDASLGRLRTDYIDLYQLHSPEIPYLRDHPQVCETLLSLQKAGKVRAIGLSARSPADALAALELFDFASVQVNFNLIDHRARESGLFEVAATRNVAIIARTPLCFGYLTGRLTGSKAKDLRGKDHRANWPEDQLQRWAQTPGLFTALHERLHLAPTQLALKFCLSPSVVSSTIPGMMSLAEVDENAAIPDLPPLIPEILDEIGTIYRSNTFYDNTAKSRGNQ